MISRLSGTFLLLIILFQIAFSFYYSSEIINQNNILDTNLQEIENYKKQNRILEKQLTDITSLNFLSKNINELNLTPINQELNIQP